MKPSSKNSGSSRVLGGASFLSKKRSTAENANNKKEIDHQIHQTRRLGEIEDLMYKIKLKNHQEKVDMEPLRGSLEKLETPLTGKKKDFEKGMKNLFAKKFSDIHLSKYKP